MANRPWHLVCPTGNPDEPFFMPPPSNRQEQLQERLVLDGLDDRLDRAAGDAQPDERLGRGGMGGRGAAVAQAGGGGDPVRRLGEDRGGAGGRGALLRVQ